MSEWLFQRYILRVMRNPNLEESEDEALELEDAVSNAIQEAEENISDLLPEGYYCKIEEA